MFRLPAVNRGSDKLVVLLTKVLVNVSTICIATCGSASAMLTVTKFGAFHRLNF
jgi:hypothetical protein